MLEPLDAAAVAAIAALYAPPGSDDPGEELLRASRGVPRRVHEAASEWARRAATERVDALAGRTAAGRSQARALGIRAGGERRRAADDAGADRAAAGAARGGLPVQGPGELRRRRRRVLLRARGARGGAGRAPGRRAAAGASSARPGAASPRSCAPGCCPRSAGGVLPGSQHWPQTVIRPGRAPGARAAPLAAARARRARRRPVRGAVHGLPRTSASGPSSCPRCCGSRASWSSPCARTSTAAARPTRELSRALGDNHVLVGPMSREELRRAIERPARRAGLVVEPELADALLADVEGEPGALPLLSTALLELWGRRDGRRLRLAAYARSGGVQGAVARLAEDAYVALDAGAAGRRAPRCSCALATRTRAARSCAARIALDEQDADVVARAHRAAAADASPRARSRSRTRRCCANGRGCAAGWTRTSRAAACTAGCARPRALGAAGATPAPSTAARRWPPRSTGRPSTAASWRRHRARLPRGRPARERRRPAPPAGRARRRGVAAGARADRRRSSRSSSATRRAPVRPPPTRNASAPRRSPRTTSTSRCCWRARASPCRTPRRPAATCSPRCSRARRRSE